MERPKFTPARWNSEDGKYSFYRGVNGTIDILPGPNSELMKWLYVRYPEYKNPVRQNPYRTNQGHIHWAWNDER